MELDCWILISTRLAGLSMASPFLTGIPWRIRWSVPAALALGMSGVAASAAARLDLSQPVAVACAIGGELVVGLLLGWSSLLVLGAIRGLASLLVDQSGLALGGAAEAATADGPPALSSFYSVLAVTIFVTLDLHHAALRAVAWSFQAIAPGDFSFDRIPAALERLLAQTGPHLFEAALCLGFPVLGVLLLAGLAQAALARVLPEADYFAFGPALRTAVGLGVACASLPFLADVSRSLFGSAILEGGSILTGAAR